MLKRIFTITLNSLREMYRDRFFLILILGVLAFFGISFLLGELSFEEHQRILFDLGISSIHWLSLGLCLFMGSNSLRRELERQTYMTLLASPLRRIEFIVGKYLGLFCVTVISTSFLGLCLFWLLGFSKSGIPFFTILLGINLEAGILLSISLLFSLLFSPFVAIFSSFGIFLMGNWLESLRFFAENSKNPMFINFAKVMVWICPNLFRLNWRSIYVLETGLPSKIIFLSCIHSMGWIGFFLFLTQVSFRRKNLI